MTIFDFEGEVVVKSQKELSKIIEKRPALSSNAFILTHSENGFPQLSIFAKENLYVLYYLDDTNSYVSINETYEENSDPEHNDDEYEDETEIFYENSKGSTTILSAGCIVGLKELNLAIEDFFLYNERSKRIKWLEL